MSDDNAPDMHLLSEYLLWNYPTVIPQAIILLEAVRVIPAECRMCRRAWRRKRFNAAETLFLTIKYTAILAWVCDAFVENSTYLKTGRQCEILHNIFYFLMFLDVFLVAFTIAWRTYVIFQCSRKVYWYLAAALGVHFALTIWVAYRQHKTNLLYEDFCFVLPYKVETIWHYSSPYWLLYNVLYDAAVTGIASWRLLRSAKHLHGLSRISRVLFYNNIHYAIIVCSINFAELVYLISTYGQQRSLLALSCAVQIITGMNLLIHEQDVVHDEAPAHVIRGRSEGSDIRINHSTFGSSSQGNCGLSTGDKGNMSSSFATKSCTTSTGVVKYDVEHQSFADTDGADLECGNRPMENGAPTKDCSGSDKESSWIYSSRKSPTCAHWDMTPPPNSCMSQGPLFGCPVYDQGPIETVKPNYPTLFDQTNSSAPDIRYTSSQGQARKGDGDSDKISLPVIVPTLDDVHIHCSETSQQREQQKKQEQIANDVAVLLQQPAKGLSISVIRQNLKRSGTALSNYDSGTKVNNDDDDEVTNSPYSHLRNRSEPLLSQEARVKQPAVGKIPMHHQQGRSIDETDKSTSTHSNRLYTGDSLATQVKQSDPSVASSWCSDVSVSVASTFGGEYHGSMVHLATPSPSPSMAAQQGALQAVATPTQQRVRRKEIKGSSGEEERRVSPSTSPSRSPCLQPEKAASLTYRKHERTASAPQTGTESTQQSQYAIRKAPSVRLSDRISGSGDNSPVLESLWRSASVSTTHSSSRTVSDCGHDACAMGYQPSVSVESSSSTIKHMRAPLITSTVRVESSPATTTSSSSGHLHQHHVRSTSSTSSVSPPAYVARHVHATSDSEVCMHPSASSSSNSLTPSPRTSPVERRTDASTSNTARRFFTTQRSSGGGGGASQSHLSISSDPFANKL